MLAKSCVVAGNLEDSCTRAAAETHVAGKGAHHGALKHGAPRSRLLVAVIEVTVHQQCLAVLLQTAEKDVNHLRIDCPVPMVHASAYLEVLQDVSRHRIHPGPYQHMHCMATRQQPLHNAASCNQPKSNIIL